MYEGIAQPYILNMNENVRVEYIELVLTNTTTLAEIKQRYHTTPQYPKWLDDDELTTGEVIIWLLPIPQWDDYWRLHFKDGLLVQIDYWIPC